MKKKQFLQNIITHRGGGVNRTNKKLVILILVIFEFVLLTLAYISYNNKDFDKYIFGSKSIKNNNLFAVMLEDSSGNYKQADLEEFPGYEYFYNNTKSGCMSSRGSIIPDSLLYDQDNRKATVKVSSSSKCYLYFDNWKVNNSFSSQLLSSNEIWQSGLEDDGFRFVGTGKTEMTTPNNFVCFGTFDQNECINNSDKFLYRIIGIFPDSNGGNHVKLIKYKQLGKYSWNNESKNISWSESSLKSLLNGSDFLTNKNYINSEWLDFIEDWSWNYVNTKSGEDGATNYYNMNSKEVYLHEMNKSGKSNTIGDWNNVTSKIGLMYISDYLLSSGEKSLTYSSQNNKSSLKGGWLYLDNNDASFSNSEWFMDFFGEFYGMNIGWIMYSDGALGNDYPTVEYGVRPVMYLKESVSSTGIGNGTKSSPYVLSSTPSNSNTKFSLDTTLDDYNLSVTLKNPVGSNYKYCLSEESNINGCNWINLSNTSLNLELQNKITKYLYVIDDADYMATKTIKFKLDELYFSEKLINSDILWQSGLEGDGYRYVGTGEPGDSTNPNNFICFGTTDVTECTGNLDKYMYRIVGVFSDSNKKYHLKLIKYTQIGQYTWNTDGACSEYDWKNSPLHDGLNGDYFLNNTTYNYLQDNSWVDLISDWTWKSVNNNAGNVGPNYEYMTYDNVYKHENNIKGASCLRYDYDMSSIVNVSCSIGVWTTSVDKFGLLRSSDYLLSMGSEINNTKNINKSWLNPRSGGNKNSSSEWLIDRTGGSSVFGSFGNMILRVGNDSLSLSNSDSICRGGEIESYMIRPVFYLNNKAKYASGTGTIDNPYILSIQ